MTRPVRVDVEHTYGVGIAQVWWRYTDHSGWTDWAGAGRVHLEKKGEPYDNGVGCVRAIHNPGVVVREEVVEFVPPAEADGATSARMVYRLLDNPGVTDHEGAVVFDELAGGKTRVTWTCRFTPRLAGAGLLMGPGIKFFFARVLRRLGKDLAAS